MTHLGKTGYAKPYRSQTACGLTASTFAIVDREPECPHCAEIGLQQLVNDEAELAAMLAEAEAA